MPELPLPTEVEPFSDELLAEMVLSTGLVTEEQLTQARAIQSERAHAGLAFRYAFAPDPVATGLIAFDPLTQAIAERIPLADSLAPSDLAEWPFYSTGDVLVCSPREPNLTGAVQVMPGRTVGLIPTARGAYLYMGVAPSNEDSPRLATLLSPVMPRGAAKSHPLDLAASSGGEFLLAANRGAGTVHVVVVNTCQQSGAIMLRAGGARRAIGMAVDRKVAYLSDGITPRLTILDLISLKVRHQPFPTGPLGPLALSPDGSMLYIVFYKAGDDLGLLTVSTADLRVRHLMNLPARKLADGPGELLQISQDGAMAYIMAANEEERPTLLVMDLVRKKLGAEIPLLELPLALAFPSPPDWLPSRPTLEDVLTQQGLATREMLQGLQAPEEGTVGPFMDPRVDPVILAQLPERLIRTMAMVPLFRDATHLSVAMVNARDAACQQLAIQLAGGLQLRIVSVETEDLERFMAERYPTLMASYQAMRNATPVARGPQMGPTPGAPPVPGRAAGSAAPPLPGRTAGSAAPPLPGRAAGSAAPPLPGRPAPAPAVPPTPVRPAPTPAAPEAPAPSPSAQATPPPRPALAARVPAAPKPPARSVDCLVAPQGRRFLLSESLKRQITEIGPERTEIWAYKGLVPGACVYLSNGHVLATDVTANRVVTIDPLTSQVAWSFGEGARVLRAPRTASRLDNGNTLIADTGNHRVIEVTVDGTQVWSHGEPARAGCSGKSLFKPGAAMRTAKGTTVIADAGNHRVIEVDAAGEIVWQFGNATNRLGGNQGSGPNQLSEPAWAWRMGDEHTLIADTGNGRVLELDADRNVVWQYRATHVKNGTAIKDPMGAWRLPEGRTMIFGRQGAIEVDPELRIVWEHHLASREATQPLASASLGSAPLNAFSEAPASGPREGTRPAETSPGPLPVRSDVPMNLPDTFLLPDRNTGRVLEIDRKMQVFWQFSGSSAGMGNRLLSPHYAVRVPEGGTLIADTGNHRVVEVRDQSIVWQAGRAGEAGHGPRQLNQPRSAERTSQGAVLVADFGNHRVIEIALGGEVRWLREDFRGPVHATRLPNGHTLAVDWADHRVVELDPAGQLVWAFGQSGYSGSGPNQLFHPEHATRLENGHTLICDTQNHRVIEVSPAREIVWQYGGEAAFLGRKGRFGIQLNTPVAAWRLRDERTVVVHAGKNHIVELDAELNMLWHFTLA